MMRKGQKSLEMIIGLVILLVVAGVVISTFLNQFQNNPGSQYKDTLKKESIKRTCSSMCQKYKEASGKQALTAAVSYCTKRFVMDANGDGTTSQVAGSLYNSYCEDGVHCFNVHSCEIGYNKLNAAKCKKIMCEYYETVSKIPASNATRRIKTWYQPSGEGDRSIGTCGLPKLKSPTGGELSTWYSKHFTGSSICTYSGNTGGGSTGGSGSNWCANNLPSSANLASGSQPKTVAECTSDVAGTINSYSGPGEAKQISPGSSSCSGPQGTVCAVNPSYTP